MAEGGVFSGHGPRPQQQARQSQSGRRQRRSRSSSKSARQPGSSPGWMRGRDGHPVVQRSPHMVEFEESLRRLSSFVEDGEDRAARQLEAEQVLRSTFDGLVRARKRLKRTRRRIAHIDRPSPRKRLAAVTLSIEAAETKFAMAEWRCKKAPSIGDNSFFLATMDAVNFAKRAHKNLDVLQAELSALQAFEANDRDNDTFTARKEPQVTNVVLFHRPKHRFHFPAEENARKLTTR